MRAVQVCELHGQFQLTEIPCSSLDPTRSGFTKVRVHQGFVMPKLKHSRPRSELLSNFNRRFSSSTKHSKQFCDIHEPTSLTIRVDNLFVSYN
jgi:hypothetical protein